MFCVPQSVKTKETNPTRPGSPTPCKQGLNEDIERIQKRALSIISPAMSYRECLDSLGLPTLYDRHNGLCRQLFDPIAINPGHKLYHLMPPRKQSSYNLRRQKLYNLPRSHMERFRRSFVCAMSQGCA